MPGNAELAKIYAKVKKRAGWIIKQQNYFRQFQPLQPPRKYISGETHRYLGRQYRLKVIQSTEEKVVLARGYINVYTEDIKNQETIKKLVFNWNEVRANKIFNEILIDCEIVLNKLKIDKPAFKMRFMKTRWGSCSRNGIITLNRELIKAPKSCIRYVITHELCHLKEYAHNKQFYNLLVSIIPDWKKQKEKLNQMADLIL